MREKKNVKSEANWFIFHRDFVPGFQSILEFGKSLQGLYDTLEK